LDLEFLRKYKSLSQSITMVHAATAPKDAPTSFDFVVVGGGTAGNVVAGRLAEKPNVSVLVIEGGKKYVDSQVSLC
jgi:ribulose 1,5-bisphosphate synthetase/thiazole synthase